MKFLSCLAFPFFHKTLEIFFIGEFHSVEENDKVALYRITIGVIWLTLLVSSFLKTCHYRISTLQNHESTPFQYDWSLFGLIRTFWKFVSVDIWVDRSRTGLERIKDYRTSKTNLMSQQKAVEEFAKTSTIETIENSGNQRIKNYVNTRVNQMSNEKALDWIKKNMKG